jgi:hypothetical protein
MEHKLLTRRTARVKKIYHTSDIRFYKILLILHKKPNWIISFESKTGASGNNIVSAIKIRENYFPGGQLVMKI